MAWFGHSTTSASVGANGGFVLDSDFTTNASAGANVTGLAFTPQPNRHYEFEVVLRTRTATATVGPRPGVSWPTGLTDGVVAISQASAAGSEVVQYGNPGAVVVAPVGGLPNTTQSWPAIIRGSFTTGPTPSGDLQITLASETQGTNVIAKAGSFIRFSIIG